MGYATIVGEIAQVAFPSSALIHKLDPRIDVRPTPPAADNGFGVDYRNLLVIINQVPIGTDQQTKWDFALVQ